MVLFNTSSCLSFSSKDTSNSNSCKRHSKRCCRRTIHTDTIQEHGFSIDIGEDQPLHISINNVDKYTFLSDTESSVCVKVLYNNRTKDEVIVIKWSTVQCNVNTCEHIALKLVNLDVETPIY